MSFPIIRSKTFFIFIFKTYFFCYTSPLNNNPQFESLPLPSTSTISVPSSKVTHYLNWVCILQDLIFKNNFHTHTWTHWKHILNLQLPHFYSRNDNLSHRVVAKIKQKNSHTVQWAYFLAQRKISLIFPDPKSNEILHQLYPDCSTADNFFFFPPNFFKHSLDTYIVPLVMPHTKLLEGRNLVSWFFKQITQVLQKI